MIYFSFHFKELGYRLFYVVLFTLMGYILYSEYFIEITLYILDIARIKAVQIAKPIESIMSYLQLSIKFTILTISIPLLLYHIYFFFRPGFLIIFSPFWKLYELGSIIFYIISPKIIITMTAYIYPGIIKIFFLPYKNMEISSYINWLPKLDEIIRLYFNISLILGLIIVLPLIIIKYIYLYCKDKKTRQEKLKDIIKGRQILYLLLASIISLLTPPDIITLLIITLPIIIIIELSSFILLLLFAYYNPPAIK